MIVFPMLVFVTVAVLSTALIVLYIKQFRTLVINKKTFAVWCVFMCVLIYISIVTWDKFFTVIAPHI